MMKPAPERLFALKPFPAGPAPAKEHGQVFRRRAAPCGRGRNVAVVPNALDL